MENKHKKYDCLALFSGGLDSLLAIKTIEKQGLKVLGVHFSTPFFGSPKAISKWKDNFDIEIINKDISEDYIKLLTEGPKNGFGKNLNPCKDCKILMLSKIKEMMHEYDAKFLITGEVVGQRPMSQTLNSLKLIEKEAGVKDLLLRPLCAKNLSETKPEKEGLVKRSKLLSIKGRGRKEQIALSDEFEISKENVPSPAGGCLLTEKENAKRYRFVLNNIKTPTPDDFRKANIGRHFFKENYYLIVGRDREENERLENLRKDNDIFIETIKPAGPSSILINLKNEKKDENLKKEATEITAFFSTKARNEEKAIMKIESKETEIKPKNPKDLEWKNLSK